MTMKIYTKTGDKGTTRLVDGRECSKAGTRVETYGAVDELNSMLGLCNVSLSKEGVAESLRKEILAIQNQLFTVGSHLACENEETRKHLPTFSPEWITNLEDSIDQMTAGLPSLRDFILPGGSESSACLHLARTICRRAERWVVRLREEGDNSQPTELSLIYLNRLSDYLFTAARFSNETLNVPNVIWVKP